MKNKFYKFLCLIIVFTVICSFLIIPTFASEDIEVSEDPSTMIIKAGTYRFNDVLIPQSTAINISIPFSFSAIAYLSNSDGGVQPFQFTSFCDSIDYYTDSSSRFVLNYNILSIEPDFGFNVPALYPVYENGWGEPNNFLDDGIQTITVTEDTSVDYSFGIWFTENTQEVISTVKSGTYQFKESFDCIEYDVYSLVQSSYTDVYWLLENHGISPSNLYYFIDDVPYLVERISLANTFAYSLVDGVPSKFNQCFAIQYRKDFSPICTTVSLDEFAGQTFYISSDQDVSYDYLSWFSSSVSQVTGVGPGEEGDVVDLSNITAEELYNILIESYPDLANDLFAYATENWLDEKLLSSYNPDLFSAILQAGSDAARDFFYNEGYDDGFDVGFSEGSSEGYGEGFSVGCDFGHQDGYSEGYDVGNVDGQNLSVSESFGKNIIVDVFSAPVEVLDSFTLYSNGVFSISLWSILQSVIMLSLIFWILKMF